MHPESVPVEHGVGPLMDKFDRTMASGGIFTALEEFFTDIIDSFNFAADPASNKPGNQFNRPYPVSAYAVVLNDVVKPLPGVTDAVIAGIPEATP